MYVADTEGFEGFNQHGNNTTTTLYTIEQWVQLRMRAYIRILIQHV